MSVFTEPKYYLQGQAQKDFSVLARFISLIESNNTKHVKLANTLLKKFKKNKSYILGVSGAPGAGKSTLINAMGAKFLLEKPNVRLAIIAIDPSSEITGGSILGDKTRMGQLAQMPQVFIRPISSKASLGGITPKLDLIIEALECWNFDLIIIETVGVGQSEAKIWPLVQDLMLVVTPGAGDDLQAMKRGLLELVDLVCVNKAEDKKHIEAEVTKEHYQSALQILQNRKVDVYLTSALKNQGINELVQWIFDHKNIDSKKLIKKNHHKKVNSLKEEMNDAFSFWLKKNSSVLKKLSHKEILKKFFASYK